MAFDLSVVTGDPASHDTPLLVVPVFGNGEEGDATPELLAPLEPASLDPASLDPASLDAVVRERVDPDAVRATEGESTLVWTGLAEGPRRVLLLGLGERDELKPESLRRFAGHAVRKAEALRVQSLTLWMSGAGPVDTERAAQSLAEGAGLAAWRFGELKTGRGGADPDEPPVDVTSVGIRMDGDAAAVERGVAVGSAVARGENFARLLQCRPGNVATPTHLADQASEMAAELGLSVDVLDPDRLREERMNALLAVSQGSAQEPRLIVLEHRGGEEGERPLVLVGKGLTFDAGGISIKPSKGMEEMKFDMSAGAAVLGAMRSIAELELPVNVVGVVPSSENLLGGKALKPGDVIHTRSGKTVEVTNTDAEGRLILADALDYALSFDPAAMVDCATLTGAVVIGLGHHAAGLLGNDEALIDEVRAAGETAGERAWPLPLWDDYRKQLRSVTADLNNVGGRPAGAITAACFLSEFVGDARWAHLDIAGTAYGTEPLSYQREGGYGFPTRLLVEWVRGRAG